MSQLTTWPNDAVTWHRKLALGIPGQTAFEVCLNSCFIHTLCLIMHLYPQFDFSTPDYRIFRTENIVQDITNDIKASSFYLDTTFYKATIEPLAFDNGVEVLFLVAGKGICIQIRGHAIGAEVGYLNFNIGIPKSFYNKARGILGDFDGSKVAEVHQRGDMDNFFKNPQKGVHHDMESCKLFSINDFGKISLDFVELFLSLFPGAVSDVDPVFFTSSLSRKKRQTLLPPVPPTFDQLNITDEMIEFCNNMTACLYDLAVTGSMAVAGETRDFFDNTTALEEQLSMTIS